MPEPALRLAAQLGAAAGAAEVAGAAGPPPALRVLEHRALVAAVPKALTPGSQVVAGVLQPRARRVAGAIAGLLHMVEGAGALRAHAPGALRAHGPRALRAHAPGSLRAHGPAGGPLEVALGATTSEREVPAVDRWQLGIPPQRARRGLVPSSGTGDELRRVAGELHLPVHQDSWSRWC